MLLLTLSIHDVIRYFDEPKNSESNGGPRWPSPAYKGLIGNVLPEFLCFSQHPFPTPTSADHRQPFPTLMETHDYLRSFARPYLSSGAIRLNTEVVRVEEVRGGGGWKVVVRDWNEGAERAKEVEESWDAVVVAVGWYDNPVWPETDGLEELRKRGLAMHAKWWRGPEGCEGKVSKRPFGMVVTFGPHFIVEAPYCRECKLIQ